MKYSSALTTILLALVAQFSCIGRYDPFSDSSNAGISISHQSIHDGDSVNVFSTETLSVIVTVKEKVESFTVHTTDNRRFSGTDTAIDRSSFVHEPFTFYFSYFDTGSHTIILTAVRDDGTAHRDTLNLHVRSPLRQDSIAGYLGQSIRLKTLPVTDRDVEYVWSFGAGTSFRSLACSTSATVLVASPSGLGSLWLTDGVHQSPTAAFAFNLGDTTAPMIVCANEGFVGLDTVYTSDSSAFGFKVSITEQGSAKVDSASINGKPFSYVSNNTYYAFIDSVWRHPASNPLGLDVYAVGRFAFGNEARKRFWVVFQDTVTRPHVSLVVTLPSHDPDTTGAALYQLVGSVECSSPESLSATLHIRSNDSTTSRLVIARATPLVWTQAIPLTSADSGRNPVTVWVTAGGNPETLAVVHRTILYAPLIPDSTPPVILSVTADGRPADNYYAPKNNARMTVKTVDEGSGILQVTIQGSPAAVDSTGQLFSSTVQLIHGTSGNEIQVVATDQRGNSAQQTLLLFYNRLPVFTRVPSARTIPVDSLYTDSAAVIDADGDPVVVTLNTAPASATISGSGTVSWTPAASDTGYHTITLKAWDGYQPVYATYQLYVYDPSKKPRPLRLATTEQQFPQYLEAGHDTLRVALVVVPGTGVAPFKYSARVTATPITLLNASASNLVTWAPQISDTGSRQLIVFASDNFGEADTLYPQVLVVPPNRPCTLSVTYASPTRTDGVIDLNARAKPDTLRYHIADPDNPLIENHALFIYQARSGTRSQIDSIGADTFMLAIDPTALNGYDTIVASIRDHGGLTDTLVSVLYYGEPPNVPKLLLPANNATLVDTPVVLRWSGSDPDNDKLYYDVFVGSSAASLSRAASVVDTAATIPGLGRNKTYFWRVDAWDWKSGTASTVISFSTRP